MSLPQITSNYTNNPSPNLPRAQITLQIIQNSKKTENHTCPWVAIAGRVFSVPDDGRVRRGGARPPVHALLPGAVCSQLPFFLLFFSWGGDVGLVCFGCSCWVIVLCWLGCWMLCSGCQLFFSREGGGSCALVIVDEIFCFSCCALVVILLQMQSLG